MIKLEAVKIANILMDNFKMPVAQRGMFDSYVVTDKDDRNLLYIGAGGLGLYIDIESLEVVKKEKRKIFTIEEIESRSGGEYLSVLPHNVGGHED
jgi:hypothetical protein